MKINLCTLLSGLFFATFSFGCDTPTEDNISRKLDKYEQSIVSSFTQHRALLSIEDFEPSSLQLESVEFDEKESAFSEALYKVYTHKEKTKPTYFVKFHKTPIGESPEEVIRKENLVKSYYQDKKFSSINVVLNNWLESANQVDGMPVPPLSVYPCVEGNSWGKMVENLLATDDGPVISQDDFKTLGKGLGELHQAGIMDTNVDFRNLQTKSLHGDLHDENILISKKDGIFLIDMVSAAAALEVPAFISQEIKSAYLQVTRFFLILEEHYSDFFFNAHIAFCKGYSEAWTQRKDVLPGLSFLLKETFNEIKPSLMDMGEGEEEGTEEAVELKKKDPAEWDDVIQKLCDAIEASH